MIFKNKITNNFKIIKTNKKYWFNNITKIQNLYQVNIHNKIQVNSKTKFFNVLENKFKS